METQTNELNELLWAKVKPDATIPTKIDGDAGYDIYACFDEPYFIIPAGQTRMVPTGIASAMPNNFYLQIEERGSTGTKGMKRSAGVMDARYRGEWFIVIYNTNELDIIITDMKMDELIQRFYTERFWDVNPIIGNKITLCNIDEHTILYPKSKAIAQAILHELPPLPPREVTYEELLAIPSDRGIGKLGSSGK